MVLVVEDDPSLRAALSSLIRSVGLEVEVFESASQFLAHGPPPANSCLLLDVQLPDKSGLEIQRVLAASGARTPIIFMSGYGDIRMSVRAIKAGAVEFLPKPFPDDDLLRAIGDALGRARLRSRDEEHTRVLRERAALLTNREKQVMQGIVRGRLNKQVAAELGVSDLTVKVHRRRVMRKMRAESLIDLVRMADRLWVK
jgi:FixJ family two-component response regulator